MSRRRFLSEADCHDISQRLARVITGGGDTTLIIVSKWTGTIRWARNQVSVSEDVRNDDVVVNRNLRGAKGRYEHINETTDVALLAAARRAERLARLERERPGYELQHRYQMEPALAPALFSETTYQLDADRRAAVAQDLAQSAVQAGMLSAGYVEVFASSLAKISSTGESRYFQYTWAQCSMTVRDPTGVGSGWAGVDAFDWSRIDGPKLAAVALDKCLKSRNPVAVEPGRYVTILEPQAVCDFVSPMMYPGEATDRWNWSNGGNEHNADFPFGKVQGAAGDISGYSKLGDKVVDERISISANPMDPELGFVPFEIWPNILDTGTMTGPVYHPTQWVTNGVLTELAYPQTYGIQQLGQPTGLPNSGSFRMSGGQTSVDEMISTTRRGLLVTRLSRVTRVNFQSQLYRGYTRDGLWLIEDGKINKPVKNMVFTESVLFALNKVDQLGVPQRVLHSESLFWWRTPKPVVVPPVKFTEFNFTALTDAV